jgi:hypothetical protein
MGDGDPAGPLRVDRVAFFPAQNRHRFTRDRNLAAFQPLSHSFPAAGKEHASKPFAYNWLAEHLQLVVDC